MSKKAKSTSVPPTVLVITLESDGQASLLTRRGDLAHLSQFTYRGLPEIVAAIQSGAVQLADLEKNPPAVVADAAPPVETIETPLEQEALTENDEDISTEESGALVSPKADSQVMPAPELPNTDDPALRPSSPQAKLF